MTEASQRALEILRQIDNFQWYLVPMIAFVGYIYLTEVENKNWSAVYCGIILSAFELIWEMVNGMILHFTEVAPLWATPGNTAYLLYIGLPIEIYLFFLVGGLLLIKALPADKNLKIAGIPNRIALPLAGAAMAVVGEVALYKGGVLAWHYWFWKWPHVYVIFINYCLPSLTLVWIHDNLGSKTKIKLIIGLSVAAVICHIIFAEVLGWV